MRRDAPWLPFLVLACVTSLAPPAVATEPQVQPILQLEPGHHAAPIRRLAVDADETIAVTASDDKTARVWDLRSGELRQTLRSPIGAGTVGKLYGAAVHPKRAIVALGGSTGESAGGHAIYLFALDTGRLVQRIDARRGDIKRLVWTADGTLLIAAYEGAHGIRAFDQSGNMVFEEAYGGGSYGLSILPTGLLASVARDGHLRVYRAEASKVTKVRQWPTRASDPLSVSLSPDETRAAIGYGNPGVPAEIVELSTGAVLNRLATVQFTQRESLGVASWSRDGKTIAVGGRAAIGTLDFYLARFDASTGRTLSQQSVSRDSVMDIVSLRDDGFAFASFEGSWGIAREAGGRTLRSTSLNNDFRGPSNLRISPDGRRVGWAFDSGRNPAWLNFYARLIETEVPPDLRAPTSRSGFLDLGTSDWENTPAPTVNGGRIKLEQGEISRAVAFVRATRDAILGTSWAIYRIDPKGTVVWRVRVPTEARAVNVSDDGRIVVSAMADGTIRWWRGADGEELLALHPTRDRRWVLWTPNGYFDASGGADGLVGWHVNRGTDAAGDFYSLGRFRERFQRPDIIDRLFMTLDVAKAREEADNALTRPVLAVVPTPPSVPAEIRPVEPHAKSALPAVTVNELPPALGAISPTHIRAAEGPIELPFTLRSEASAGEVTIEVRIDGRPADVLGMIMPSRQDGASSGKALILAPQADAALQILARNRYGFSEPLGFRFEHVARPPTFKPVGLKPEPASAPPISVAMTGRPPKPLPVTVPPSLPAPPWADASPSARPSPPMGMEIETKPPPSASDSTLAAISPRAETAKPMPKLYVLAIGVSEYQRSVYRLGFPAKDARDFAETMARQKGRLYRDAEIRVLANAQATKAAVEKHLKWIAEEVGPDDVGMLFLAGHGLNSPEGAYFFIPHEGQHENLEASAVPESAIRNALRSIRGRTLFFVDTCHAGNVVGSFKSASRELARLANNLASAENGVVVFASSTGKQQSEERDEWRNGAFTKALLEGLAGRADLARRGNVTFKGLDFYLSDEVPRLTNGRQTPVTIVPIGVPDFALAVMAF